MTIDWDSVLNNLTDETTWKTTEDLERLSMEANMREHGGLIPDNRPVVVKYFVPYMKVLWTYYGTLGVTTLVEYKQNDDEPLRLSVFTAPSAAESIVKAVEGACLGLFVEFCETNDETNTYILSRVSQGKTYYD